MRKEQREFSYGKLTEVKLTEKKKQFVFLIARKVTCHAFQPIGWENNHYYDITLT